MKVIVVNRYFAPDQSATSRMATSLAQGLVAQGHEVEAIAAAAFHDAPDRTLPSQETIGGVSVFRVQGTRFGRGRLPGRALDYLTFHLGAATLLAKRAAAGNVCIVCTDPPLMAASAWPVLKARGARLVNWVHDLFPEVAFEAGVVKRAGLLGRLAVGLRDLTLSAAAANVAPTERMAEGLVRRGASSPRSVVIPQWSEGGVLTPLPAERSRLRRQWGLSGKFVVGYCGNLGRAHDFSTVLDAAERLRERDDIIFLFVGGGHRRAFVEREATARRLINVVMHPLQPVELLRDCLAAPDVHVVSLLPRFEPLIVPSKYYGVAAAGRGALFVGAADGEIATLLARNDCGAAFPVGAGAELAAEIERLAAAPDLVEAQGKAARALFDARFSRERALAAWNRVIMSCANEARPPVPATRPETASQP